MLRVGGGCGNFGGNNYERDGDMKYMCKKCGGSDPCFIDWTDAPAPEYCPCDGEEVIWRKVSEPAALPKLTVEALAERGIAWPEWAVCAGVHAFGRLMFFEQRPRLNTSIGGWDYYGFDPIPKMSDTNDFFDYSDWQNSLIMRPEKVEKPQLPDWLKIGSWAAVGKFVGKIDWISRDSSECRITCGESRFANRDEVKAVTWRTWTRSEWCEQIGERFKFSDGERMLLGVSDYESGFMIEFIDRDEAPDEFISEWHITQLNGMPCGVPQVDGKDLEG